LPPAERLLGMSDGQMDIGVLRRTGEQLSVEPDGTLVLAEGGGGGRVELLEKPVLGLFGEKPVELAAGVEVLVKPDQDLGIFPSRGSIARRQLENGREQDLGVVEHLVHDADSGKQPHAFHMIAVLQEKRAHQGFGRIEVAVREQPGSGHDLLRQVLERRHVTRRHGRVVGLPRHAEEPLEHGPARRQRVIDVHRLQKCRDGLGCLLLEDEAMASLLVEAAEAWVVLLENRERAQGLGDPVQQSLRDGHQQPRIPRLGDPCEQIFAGTQHVGKPTLPEQRAQLGDIDSTRGQLFLGGREVHDRHRKKKGRTLLSAPHSTVPRLKVSDR
jgi:hypothetical protein